VFFRHKEFHKKEQTWKAWLFGRKVCTWIDSRGQMAKLTQ
jgi:hypothetical protein